MPTRRTIFALAIIALLLAAAWWLQRQTTSADSAITPPIVAADPMAAAGDVHRLPTPQDAMRTEVETAAQVASTSKRSGGELTIITARADGRPIAGIPIRLTSSEGTLDAITDAEGRSVFDAVRLALKVVATPEGGWVQVFQSSLRQLDSQDWLPVTITLTPAATLRVQVVDQAGSPLERHGLHLAPAPAAVNLRENVTSTRSFDPSVSMTTDLDGWTRPFVVPAELRLLLHCNGAEYEWQSADSSELRRDSTDAVPFILQVGESRDVVVRQGPRCLIEGTVLEHDGTPAVRAHILAIVMATDSHPNQLQLGDRHSNSDGSFAIGWVEARAATRVLVCARSALGEETTRNGLTLTFLPPTDPTFAAWTEVTLGTDGQASGPVLLQLRELPDIAGQITNDAGQPLAGRIRLQALDDTSVHDHLLSGVQSYQRVDADGSFRFVGVPPGRYELLACCAPLRTVRFGPIDAGDEAVSVVIPRRASAQITVRVESEIPIDRTSLCAIRVDPAAGMQLDSRDLPVDAVFDDLFGRPTFDIPYGVGVQNFVPSQGTITRFEWASRDPAFSIELDAGLYWIYAQASSNGTPLYPGGTGLVRVATGDYEVRLRLRDLASIDGRVVGASSTEDLHVAIATDDGRLVTHQGNHNVVADLFPLSPAGHFYFPQVPTGRFELRIGTAAELRAGRAQVRRSIELSASETLTLELER